MTANNCPLGRAYCDGCNYLTTCGCIAKQNTSHVFSITHDGMVALWERRKEELMKLSKEDLVEMLIGKKKILEFYLDKHRKESRLWACLVI